LVDVPYLVTALGAITLKDVFVVDARQSVLHGITVATIHAGAAELAFASDALARMLFQRSLASSSNGALDRGDLGCERRSVISLSCLYRLESGAWEVGKTGVVNTRRVDRIDAGRIIRSRQISKEEDLHTLEALGLAQCAGVGQYSEGEQDCEGLCDLQG